MDLASLPPDLREMAAAVKDPRAGFLGPDSHAWRILRENVIQLGGPCAALMQVAHPHVGQGVAEHSDYKNDPIGRLERTFKTVHKVVFGTMDDALEAAMATRRIHTRVKGMTPTEAGPFPAQSRYHANRADLLLWVHATLVTGAIQSYEHFVQPLDYRDKNGLYQDLKIFGRLFGIPLAGFPVTYHDFEDYYQDAIEHTLAVAPAGRDVGATLMKGQSYYRLASPLLVVMASGFMPRRIRKQYGLPWNPAMKLTFDQMGRGIRQARPFFHKRVLYRGAYLGGMKRTKTPLKFHTAQLKGGLVASALREVGWQ
jgi:uncharacterized protein (DUF2236 family)